MFISVFLDYIVETHCKYSYLNEEGDFRDDEFKTRKTVSGGELMDEIAKHILDSDTITVDICDKSIIIDIFNDGTGETTNYKYTFTAITGGN